MPILIDFQNSTLSTVLLLKQRESRSMGWRRKKERSSSSSETLISSGKTQKGGGFFACYLLTSLSPRHKGHTYIGFTVNPRRRIRQHNGELRSGAWRTKTKRPWEMVFCIYGFPTNVSALQFEWAWQHPFESLAVRNAAVALKSLRGLAGKIKLAFTMLTLPAWQSLPLTVNFFSTKYTKHSAGCPGLPEHMKVHVSSMEDLPCYTRAVHSSTNEEDEEEDDCDHDQVINNNTSNGDAMMEKGVIDMTVESHGIPWKNMEDTADEDDEDDCEHDQVINNNTSNGNDATMEKVVIDMTVESHGIPWKNMEYHEDEEEDDCDHDRVISNTSNGDATMEKGVIDMTVESPGILWKNMEDDTAADVQNGDTSVRQSPPHLFGLANEVIDLLSPSPSPAYRRRIKSDRNMNKFSAACPKIIDLTGSPIYV